MTDRHITNDLRSLNYRSAIPGGFASATLSLNRPLAVKPDEIGRYGRMYVYDNSGQTVWEGRVEDFGRNAGDSGEVYEISAIGPSGHAHDITQPLMYVDRRLEVWLTSSFSQASTEVSTVNELTPAVRLAVARGTVCNIGYIGDVTYQEMTNAAAGLHLGRIAFDWDAGVTDSNWTVAVLTRTGTGGSGGIISSGTWNVAGGSIAVAIGDTNFNAGNDVVNLRITRNTSNQTVANDDTWATFGGNISVRSTLYNVAGSEITTGAFYGHTYVLASDIVADLLGRMLPKYDGPGASIYVNSDQIDQLIYPDGTDASRVLDDLMAIETNNYWAAWESNPTTGLYRFEWTVWPSRIRFDADIDDGVDFPDSSEGLYNQVTVRWIDNTGRVRSTTRTQVVDELSAVGLVRRGFVDLGSGLATQANANQAGDQFLIEHRAAPNRGTLTIARPVVDYVTGRMVHPWELPLLAPGNLIRTRQVMANLDVLNATARDGVTVFRVVGATFDANSMSCQLELDAPPPTLQHVLAGISPSIPTIRR
jgi:hypothetical protein